MIGRARRLRALCRTGTQGERPVPGAASSRKVGIKVDCGPAVSAAARGRDAHATTKHDPNSRWQSTGSPDRRYVREPRSLPAATKDRVRRPRRSPTLGHRKH